MKMCEAFSLLGNKVYLITPEHSTVNKNSNINPFQFYGVKNNFSIIRLRKIGEGSAKMGLWKKINYNNMELLGGLITWAILIVVSIAKFKNVN